MKIALSDEFINTARCLVPGELLVASPTDPSQSAAEGQGLEEAELGAESNFTITTRDSEARQFNKEGDQVTVKICSPTGEAEIEPGIDDCKDGIYIVR